MQYSYSFSDELQQQWDWSERYAPQPEILKYAKHVAERFNLRSDIQFDTRVDQAAFDESANVWSVTNSDGNTVTAKHVVSRHRLPVECQDARHQGPAGFQGPSLSTGHWPHEPVDFTGQRVAVIGTGSSAIQAVPLIARRRAISRYSSVPRISPFPRAMRR